MDEALIRLDARLGALELLVRNLYAHRFASQADPLGAAEQALSDAEKFAKRIEVVGPEPVVNDMLAAEAEEFFVAMFREIVEIVRESADLRPTTEGERASLRISNDESAECPQFPPPVQKFRRTG